MKYIIYNQTLNMAFHLHVISMEYYPTTAYCNKKNDDLIRECVLLFTGGDI